jgi:hypothetical protein
LQDYLRSEIDEYRHLLKLGDRLDWYFREIGMNVCEIAETIFPRESFHLPKWISKVEEPFDAGYS